jgi:protein-S-isoprenylcysteine O-methyltransferase Ste14
MADLKNIVSMFVQFSAAALILIIALVLSRPWNNARLVGLAIALPSIGLLVTARLQLGRSFSLTPQARGLVTHGLYSKFRNPMYVFSALYLLGLTILVQRPYLLLFFCVLVPVQIMRARREAHVLEERFGEAYREYKRQTWF